MHEQFGTCGAWLNPALGDAPRIEYAPQLEELGYQMGWVGIGADPVGDMNLLEQMTAATRHAIVASKVPAEAIVIGALGTNVPNCHAQRRFRA